MNDRRKLITPESLLREERRKADIDWWKSPPVLKDVAELEVCCELAGQCTCGVAD